jgi:Lhr-like helicase
MVENIRVYLVSDTFMNNVKCIKIVEKDKFSRNEWETTKQLIGRRNKSIIEYYSMDTIDINDTNYAVFLLEYANAKL